MRSELPAERAARVCTESCWTGLDRSWGESIIKNVVIDRFQEPRDQPRRPRPTLYEIQKWVDGKHGFLPKAAWIEHCQELYGITKPSFKARAHADRCPPEYQPGIRQALAHFGMLPED